MMIGPEQGKKASGKSGKKKGKAKKAKRRAAERDLGAPVRHGSPTAPPTAASDPAVASGSGARPPIGHQAVGSPVSTASGAPSDLLAWIDRVQGRVDHLLTLVDPALAAPLPDPAAGAPAGAPAAADDGASAADQADDERRDGDGASVDSDDLPRDARPEPESEPSPPEGTMPVPDGPVPSLAEAWARRQQQQTVASRDDEPDDEPDDDEPFEPVDARLTAILVARELIARGQSPADVRRRLREGYGVADPETVLAQVAA